MAKSNLVWDGITEDDFRSETTIDDQDIGDHNKAGMTIYQANVNYARQMARAEDSLKPVERRILYTCHLLNAVPGHDVKSAQIMGSLLSIHNHSDSAAYTSMINMAQYWKKNIPLITGNCNLGVITAPDEYAASRYTEVTLTKYAQECFFEDYDDKVITTNGFLVGVEEPESLPSKFPNILINGNSGIGNGFASFMPPFNVYDVIEVCKKVIENPNISINELVIAPDFPTECDIVENTSEIEQYCKTGKGNITMRGRIDIEDHGNTWVLAVKSIPYGVPFPSIKKKIMTLGKSGAVAIKAVHEESKTYVADDGSTRKYLYFDVEIPKSLDPVKVRSILYKNCDLEKTTPMQATVVVDDGKTTIKTINIKELIQYWIDTRRMYKRSRYNHRINRTESDIEITKAMIFMLSGTNLETTVGIIRSSTSDTIVANLIKAYGKTAKLNSYQAKIIAAKPLSAFTKDAAKKYEEDLKRLEKLIKELRSTAYSAEKIDAQIIAELNELRKYGSPNRKSSLITVTNEKEFLDSTHRLVFTKFGHIKKLPEIVDSHHTKAPFGTFEQGDTVSDVIVVNNSDGLLMFNDRGRYSIIPVNEIPNSIYGEYGDNIFNISKLDGKIINNYVIEGKDFRAKKKKSTNIGKDTYVVSLSTEGYMKKTLLSEYIIKDGKTPIMSIKNSIAANIKGGSNLICDTSVIPTKYATEAELLVYTKKGDYVLLPGLDGVAELGKNAAGTMVISSNECAGFSLIYPDDVYALVVTKKGCMKKIELKYLSKTKRKDASYISTISDNDEIIAIKGCNDNDTVKITTKTGERTYSINEIPVMARKASPKKIIPIVSSSDEVCSAEMIISE